MQALQYARILQKIVKEMKVSELVEFMAPLLARGSVIPIVEAHRDQLSVLLFASRAGFERLMADPSGAKVLESLKVDTIYDPKRLARLVNAVATVANAGQIQGSVDFFQFYAQVTSLANLARSCFELLEKEKLEPAQSPDQILELEVIDYDGLGIEPLRLERLISILIRLHTNFARILGVKDDQLRFIYFDSGSDLLIGIQCAKTVLESMRTLLNEWWDKVRFWNFETFDKKMTAVSKGLTVLETVKHAVETEVIDEETGKVLQTHVLREVDQLIGLGVSLPVCEDAVDHRKLLTEKRDTKLLGSGDPPEEA